MAAYNQNMRHQHTDTDDPAALLREAAEAFESDEKSDRQAEILASRGFQAVMDERAESIDFAALREQLDSVFEGVDGDEVPDDGDRADAGRDTAPNSPIDMSIGGVDLQDVPIQLRHDLVGTHAPLRIVVEPHLGGHEYTIRYEQADIDTGPQGGAPLTGTTPDSEQSVSDSE